MRSPLVWTCAGMDPSGNAGVLVDMQVMHSLGVRAKAVTTVVTAQNSYSCRHLFALSSQVVSQQVCALQEEEIPSVIKIGVLGNAEIIQTLSKVLDQLSVPMIIDPVFYSTSGKELLSKDGIKALQNLLIPRASLITPNHLEAEILTGQSLSSAKDYPLAAKKILAMGARAVLIKGGHGSDSRCFDYYACCHKSFWICKPRIDREVRGTGCCLSSAIAAAFAQNGVSVEATIKGIAYTQRAIRKASSQLHIDSWPVSAQEMPQIFDRWEDCCREQRPSAKIESLMGFYPIVPNSSWVKFFVDLGVQTIQLRIKDQALNVVEEEIKESVNYAARASCHLFINDYWEFALKYRAYGIHLGQSDLKSAGWEKIKSSKIHLGISTHSYEELARALGYLPSYIALGPIFPTTSKIMPFSPQGIGRIGIWNALTEVPIVAIGGMTAENALDAFEAGAEGVACIRDVLDHPNPTHRTKAWLNLWRESCV